MADNPYGDDFEIVQDKNDPFFGLPVKKGVKLEALPPEPQGNSREERVKAVKEFDATGGAFGRGVTSGVLGIGAGLAGMGEILSKVLPGQTEAKEFWKRKGDDLTELQRAIPMIASDIRDLKDAPQDLGAWIAEGLGQSAPYLAAAALSGGAGAAAKATTTAARLKAAIPGAAILAPIFQGQSFRDIREETGVEAPVTALGVGAAQAALEPIAEVFMISRLFNKAAEPAKKALWRTLVRDTAKTIAKQAFAEAGTEAAQEAVGLLGNQLADSTYKLVTSDNIWKLANAAAAGFAVGGVTSGVFDTATSAYTKLAQDYETEQAREGFRQQNINESFERARRAVTGPGVRGTSAPETIKANIEQIKKAREEANSFIELARKKIEEAAAFKEVKADEVSQEKEVKEEVQVAPQKALDLDLAATFLQQREGANVPQEYPGGGQRFTEPRTLTVEGDLRSRLAAARQADIQANATQAIQQPESVQVQPQGAPQVGQAGQEASASNRPPDTAREPQVKFWGYQPNAQGELVEMWDVPIQGTFTTVARTTAESQGMKLPKAPRRATRQEKAVGKEIKKFVNRPKGTQAAVQIPIIPTPEERAALQAELDEQLGQEDIAEEIPASPPAVQPRAEAQTAAPAPQPAPAATAAPTEQLTYPRQKLVKGMTDLGYRYEPPSLDSRQANPNAVRIGGSVYPTFVSGDGAVKLAFDTTDIFEKNGEVWIGDPTAPIPDGIVGQAVITDPEKRGQGLASKVIKDLVKVADQYGLRLIFEPAQMKSEVKKGQKALSTKELVAWYKKLGFEQRTPGSDLILERSPLVVESTKEAQPTALPPERAAKAKKATVSKPKKKPEIESVNKALKAIDPKNPIAGIDAFIDEAVQIGVDRYEDAVTRLGEELGYDSLYPVEDQLAQKWNLTAVRLGLESKARGLDYVIADLKGAQYLNQLVNYMQSVKPQYDMSYKEFRSNKREFAKWAPVIYGVQSEPIPHTGQERINRTMKWVRDMDKALKDGTAQPPVSDIFTKTEIEGAANLKESFTMTAETAERLNKLMENPNFAKAITGDEEEGIQPLRRRIEIRVARDQSGSQTLSSVQLQNLIDGIYDKALGRAINIWENPTLSKKWESEPWLFAKEMANLYFTSGYSKNYADIIKYVLREKKTKEFDEKTTAPTQAATTATESEDEKEIRAAFNSLTLPSVKESYRFTQQEADLKTDQLLGLTPSEIQLKLKLTRREHEAVNLMATKKMVLAREDKHPAIATIIEIMTPSKQEAAAGGVEDEQSDAAGMAERGSVMSVSPFSYIDAGVPPGMMPYLDRPLKTVEDVLAAAEQWDGNKEGADLLKFLLTKVYTPEMAKRILETYPVVFTMQVGPDGMFASGQFDIQGALSVQLKQILLAANATDPDVGVHELLHPAASYLSPEDRKTISELRIKALSEAIRKYPALESQLKQMLDGQITSKQFVDGKMDTRIYHLINDDEFFAKEMGKVVRGDKSATVPSSIVERIISLFERIIEYFQKLVGRDQYFKELLVRIKNGDFDANPDYGLLFESRDYRGMVTAPTTAKAVQEALDETVTDEQRRELRQRTAASISSIATNMADSLQQLPEKVRKRLAVVSGLIEAHKAASGAEKGAGSLQEAAEVIQDGPERAAALSSWFENGFKLENRTLPKLKRIRDKTLEGVAELREMGPAIDKKKFKADVEAEIAKGIMQDATDATKRMVENLQKEGASVAKIEQMIKIRERIFKEKGVGTGKMASALKSIVDNLTVEQIRETPADELIEKAGVKNLSRDYLLMIGYILNLSATVKEDLIALKDLQVKANEQAAMDMIGDVAREMERAPRATVMEFLRTYANQQKKSAAASRIVNAYKRKLATRIRRVSEVQQAVDYLEGHIQSDWFKRDMKYAIESLGVKEVIRREGKERYAIRYENPYNPAEHVEYAPSFDQAGFELNQNNLTTALTWMQQAVEDPKTSETKRAAYQEEMLFIREEILHNRMFSPKETGAPDAWKYEPSTWLIRKLAVATPDYVGKYIPGAHGMEYSIALKNASEVSGRIGQVMNERTPKMMAALDLAAKKRTINEGGKERKMTIPEWEAAIGNKMFASWQSPGGIKHKVGSNLPTGYTVTKDDWNAFVETHGFKNKAIETATKLQDVTQSAKFRKINVEEEIAGVVVARDMIDPTGFYTSKHTPSELVGGFSRWQTFKNSAAFKDEAKKTAEVDSLADEFMEELILPHIESFHDNPYTIKSPLARYYRQLVGHWANGGTARPADFDSLVEQVYELVKVDPDNMAADLEFSQEKAKELMRFEVEKMFNNGVELVSSQSSAGKVTEDPLGAPDVSIISGDSFVNNARGPFTLPPGSFIYGAGTDSARKKLANDVLALPIQRFLNANNMVHRDAVRLISEYTQVKDEALAQKLSRDKVLAGEVFMDLALATQLREWTGDIQSQVKSFRDKSYGEPSEVMGIGKKAYGEVTGLILSAPGVVVRNTAGISLMSSLHQDSLGIGSRVMLLGNTMEQLSSDLEQTGYPLTGAVVSGASRLAKAAERATSKVSSLSAYGGRPTSVAVGSLFKFADRATNMFEYISTALGHTMFNSEIGRQWREELAAGKDFWIPYLSTLILQSERQAMVYDRAKSLNLVQPWKLADSWKQLKTAFEYRSLESAKTSKQSGFSEFANIVNAAFGAIVEVNPVSKLGRMADSMGNFSAISEVYHIMDGEIGLNVAHAYENRIKAGVGIDPNNWITPQEFYYRRSANEETLNNLKRLFATAGVVNFDKAMYDYAVARSVNKELKLSDHLHEAMDGLITGYANETNRSALSNRPMVFTGPVARHAFRMWGYPAWFGGKLAQEMNAYSRDKGVKRSIKPVLGMLTFLVPTLILSTMAVNPIVNWLQYALWGEKRQMPSLDLDKTPLENFEAALKQTASMLPPQLNAVLALRGIAKPSMDINPITIFPMSLWNTFTGTVKAAAQTGDYYQASLELLRTWVPNSRAIINRFDDQSGLVYSRSLNRTLRANSPSDIEVRQVSLGGSSFKLSPYSDLYSKAVNALADPKFPNIEEARSYYEQAVAEMRADGVIEPEEKAYQAIVNRNPIQVVYGRRITNEEFDRVKQRIDKMDDETGTAETSHMDKVLEGFNQFAKSFGREFEPVVGPRSRGAAVRTSGLVNPGGRRLASPERLLRSKTRYKSRAVRRY